MPALTSTSATHGSGHFVLAQIVGGALSGLIWGRIADHLGALPVIYLSAILLVVPCWRSRPRSCPVAPSWCSSSDSLARQAADAASAFGSTSSTWSIDRRLYTGLVNTANSPSLLMPLVGSLVLAAGGFDGLFLVTAAAGVGAWLTLQLTEPVCPDPFVSHVPRSSR
jgi:hypothetical protein